MYFGNVMWIARSPVVMEGYQMLEHVNSGEQMMAPDPSIVLKMESPTRWTFKFSHSEGHGFIRVGLGCDYNPFCMVEALFHQLEKADMFIDLNQTSGKVHMNIDTTVQHIDEAATVEMDESTDHSNWLSDDEREDMA